MLRLSWSGHEVGMDRGTGCMCLLGFLVGLEKFTPRALLSKSLYTYDFFPGLGLLPPWLCLGVPCRAGCSCRGVVLPLVG